MQVSSSFTNQPTPPQDAAAMTPPPPQNGQIMLQPPRIAPPGGRTAASSSSASRPRGSAARTATPRAATARLTGGPAATRPVQSTQLSGASAEELQRLSNQFDTETAGVVTVPRTFSQDAQTTQTLRATTTQSLTGYPQDVVDLAGRIADMQGQLATLDRGQRDFYAGALATLDATYRNTTDTAVHDQLRENVSKLEDSIRAESTRAQNDPLERVMSVFNAPVGAGYLDGTGKDGLKRLQNLREDFLNAPDAAAREQIFKRAVDEKSTAQGAVKNALANHMQTEQAKWDDANRYVGQIIQEAASISDPTQRYESIGRKLFSNNTGMGEDDVADRRVLAFTQKMQGDPDLRAKLAGWKVDAGERFNRAGVEGPLGYEQIPGELPKAGPDYVRDLGERYTNVLKDTSAKSKTVEDKPKELFKQIAEGTLRFLLGVTPFAPLAQAFDANSSLPPSARLGIDLGAAIVGMAASAGLGLASNVAKAPAYLVEAASALEDAGAAARAVEPVVAEAATAAEDASHAGAFRPVVEGPSPEPAMLANEARLSGKPLAVPDDYRADIDASALKPDENAAGILRDDQANRYIQSGDRYYQTKFDPDNNTWRVVNPDTPSRYTYPVQYDPASGAWGVHGNVGLPGGGPLSRLVSLSRFKSDPRVARLLESKLLKPQDPQTCYLDHGRVAQHAIGIPDGRLKPVAAGALNAQQLRAELEKGPLVLSARNIARPDSSYSGMHTVVLLKSTTENGRDTVLGIDLDDTIRRIGTAQNMAAGDFGGVQYDLKELVKQATPYVDEETGAQLDMYSRPSEKGGFWKFWS